MKIKELLEKEEFRGIKNEVDAFARIMLDQYMDDVQNGFYAAGGKEIFDVIWGPVEFNSGEILILDSPLIQRLRKIKQLGLASYVYCGADYSRLSHTIGVFHLADRMAGQIEKYVGDGQKKYNFVQIVRLAALFHDAGHMYYSHVSERYFEENGEYSRYEEVKHALVVFDTCANVKASLHELIAVMLVNSESVKALLKLALPQLELPAVKTDSDLNEIIEFISCFIIGQANGEEMLPYYQILNGPVDADKCDYLSRDSHATNVPVAVDIFRLIYKLNLERGKAPNNVLSSRLWEGNSTAEVYCPTIRSSALEALNQLVMARSIMYNSVYYHQKVRTAETMFRKVLEQLNQLKLPVVNNFTTALQMPDDAFGYLCLHTLRANGDVDEEQLRAIADRLNLVNFRFLMKRACSIDRGSWDALDAGLKYQFERDILKLSDLDRMREIEAATKEEYFNLCHILKRPDSEKREFAFMEFPRADLSDSIPDAVISYGNGEVKRAADIFQAGTWIESKESRNREQYLVSNCLHRDLAYLALQKVLYMKYRIILKIHSAICSKVPFSKIEKERRRLFEKGCYNDCLILVSHQILERFPDDISRLCEKYQTFEGANGSVVTKDKLRAYLTQFLRKALQPDEAVSMLDGVIRLLGSAVYISRQVFTQGMNEVLERLLEGHRRIHMCPLGGLQDSASHMSYYLNDLHLSEEKFAVHQSLQEAIAQSQEEDRIVFFDDGAYSGMQVSSIIEEYMGVAPEERSTAEQHVAPLSEQEKTALGKRHMFLAYLCFNSKNESLIQEKAEKAGMHIEGIEYMHDMQGKVFESNTGIFAGSDQCNLVRARFHDIGVQLLESTKKIDGKYKSGWSAKRVEKGALGYNDAQQMVVLKSSVPTYSLTPFWLENGVYEGMPWVPLFPRTNK